MLISLQVFTLLGIFIPGAWTPFHDLIIAGLSLFEAIFLPFIFFLCDSAFREATKKSCYCQKSDKISSKSQHHHASLAFSERNLLSPSYLSGKKSGLTTFQSELDLSKTQDSKGKVFILKNHEALSKPLPSHATSMLDLSCRTPYQQQQHQSSRSRHSVALLQHLPNNLSTPRSSFRRRPPSIASYHYLYSSNQNGINQNVKSKYAQYMFGAVPSKSETTLNVVPMSSANYFTPPSMIGNPLKEIKENEVDLDPKVDSMVSSTNCHLNRVPSNNDLSRPILGRPAVIEQINNERMINGKSGAKLKDFINGITARSSFKRRSVRKSGSDASTFYTRNRNLKRSQIAQNQLSSILYNNFYTKKLASVAFGSQITLLDDQHRHETGTPLGPFGSQMPSRHLSYDFSQHSPMANSHVYLPSTTHLETNNRSSSCNQLSALNGDYHNHLLVKQNFAIIGNDTIMAHSNGTACTNEYVQQNMIPEDEHIYASLPEEEEEDVNRQSGSFSARSTLPDNCQLINYDQVKGVERNPKRPNNIDYQTFNNTESSSSSSSSDDQDRDRTLKRSTKDKISNNGMVDKSHNQSLSQRSTNLEEIEPSTLSMAAICYNRFILNESGHTKEGHRQRSKLSRRQSFSTAYELRQRILVNQLNHQQRRLEDEVIEEESEQSLMLNEISTNFDQLMMNHNFEDIFSYKLNRRISTSEDNLLSIISTVANCGDDAGDQEYLLETEKLQSPNKTISPLITIEPDQSYFLKTNDDTKNGTFVKRELSNKSFTKNERPNRQFINSAIPRASNLSSKSVQSSPNKFQTTNKSQTTNISIKELKSKKQATKKQPNNDNGGSQKLRPKSAMNNDRISELGSLWDRSNVTSANTKPTINQSSYNKNSSSIGANKMTTTKPINKTNSSSSSPSRVPTFIPALSRKAESNGTNFTSKLAMPSQYIVKSTKQNARQNAILAKKALMLDDSIGNNEPSGRDGIK
ncbi:hypothetical protein BLOT_009207 [Blomia tropicalis]|nr:hypothetical protein BLOT_009207 [Blomia tropicalis]